MLLRQSMTPGWSSESQSERPESVQDLHCFHLLLSHLNLSCLTFLGQSSAVTQDSIPVMEDVQYSLLMMSDSSIFSSLFGT
jgi:hypothetical protein